MRRHPVAASLLAVLALLSAACSGGGGEDRSPLDDGDGGGSEGTVEDGESGEAVEGEGWTVLVYSIADTNLEPFLLEDIVEMAGVGSTEGLNIVALADRAAEYTDEALLGVDDWETAKLFEVGADELLELDDQGEANMGDPQVLADFVEFGISTYPAANYALVLTDHGASWPGVGGDESTDDHDQLTIAEMQDAIASGLDATGVDKLSLLGFDACLMATYEVATAMQTVADFMVASEELEPGHGWDYEALSIVADDPDTSPEDLGRAIVAGFQAQAEEQETDAEITLALLDLGQMPILDEAMATFSQAMIDEVASVAPVAGETRADNLSFGRNPDPALDTHMTDLGLLVSAIGIESLQVSDEADAVLRAINDLVIDRVEGVATQGSTGLSIYFPPEIDFADARYLELAETGGWADFLSAFYDQGAAIPEAEQAEFVEGIGPETFFDEDGFNIVGQFELAAQDNLTEAIIRYGIFEADGSITYLGEEPAFVSDDGSGVALGIYDLTVFTITDGIDTMPAYLALTFDEESGVATIDTPMAYYEPGVNDVYTDVLLSITFDPETAAVLSETYYAVDEEGNYGEIAAEPDGIMVPMVPNLLADGTEEWIPTSDVGLFADLPALQYDFSPLDSGTPLHAELIVFDYGGNSDFVSADVTVP